jgi:hypothetical protein
MMTPYVAGYYGAVTAGVAAREYERGAGMSAAQYLLYEEMLRQTSRRYWGWRGWVLGGQLLPTCLRRYGDRDLDLSPAPNWAGPHNEAALDWAAGKSSFPPLRPLTPRVIVLVEAFTGVRLPGDVPLIRPVAWWGGPGNEYWPLEAV